VSSQQTAAHHPADAHKALPQLDANDGALASTTPAQASTRRGLNLLMAGAWLVVVVLLMQRHVMWRDEVRALSLALQGDNLVAMLQGLHGEGHPALWYLLLRLAHTVVGRPEILPAVALVVAVAACLLLVLKSPFPWPMIALVLLGHYFLVEFSVMARNYGISMLVLFALAACYRTQRRHGIVLGVLLFLLEICNVHSVILAAGFLLFWLIEILQETGLRWSRALTHFAINAMISALGVVVCVLTVFPTFNEAAIDWPSGHVGSTLVASIIDPAANFAPFMVTPETLLGRWKIALESVSSLVLFGAALGLIRRPGAFVAALVTLIGFSVFFALGVYGSYRHDAVWFSFLLVLYWNCWDAPGGTASAWNGRTSDTLRMVPACGVAALTLLLSLQAMRGVSDIKDLLHGAAPRSRSAEFAAFLKTRPDLKDAVLVADPDYLLEPLPYYLDNQTYLLRQQRYGRVVPFTMKARLNLGLDDILQAARTLHGSTGKPVVILLGYRLDSRAAVGVHPESYVWTLTVTQGGLRSFQDSTSLLRRFEPATTDESFDASLLK
jgi:hypothetical protein